MDAGCLVQRTGWTRDPDVFLRWLSAIPFVGGGFNDAAMAEGLSEALMVYMLYKFYPFKFQLIFFSFQLSHFWYEI